MVRNSTHINRGFLGALFLIIASISYSQNQPLADSLKKTLRASSKIDFDLLTKIAISESNPDSAMKYAQKLLQVSNEKSPEHYYQGLLILGSSYRFKGDSKKALEYLFKGADFATMNGLSNYLISSAYGEISTVYYKSSDLVNAIRYIKISMSSLLKLEKLTNRDSTTMGLIYFNLGYYHYKLNNTDSSQYYTLLAEDVFREAKSFPLYVIYCEGNLLLIQAKKENQDYDFETKLNAIIPKLEKYGDNFAISDYLIQLSIILLEQDKTSKAMEYAKRGLEIAMENDFKEQIQTANKSLSEAYFKIGDFESAYAHQSAYFSYRDSLVNRELIQQLANLSTEYEVGQKQAEVDLLTAEKKIQQLMLIAAIGFAIIFIILASIIYKYYRNKNEVARVLELQKLELERLNSTKDKFFSIISHDLRGPISSFFGISRMIKFLVKSKETDQLLEIADDIDQSVERLSNLLDNLLNWAMQQQGHIPNVPEKLEFKYMAMDLAATFKTMADSKKIKLSVEVDDSIQLWADRNMTMTIFRNLINNALKFTPENGNVTLFATEREGMIFVGVKDTGVGMPKEKLESLFTLGDKKSTYGTSGEKGLGLGLQLVYEFIELNNGEIKVSSEPGDGTTFEVVLPAFEGEGILQKGV